MKYNEVIVNADSKREAMKQASKKGYSDGSLVTPAVPISARPHPKMRGKYIVKIRRDKRYV